MLPEEILKELEKLFQLPNVIGFSKEFHPRIKANVVLPDTKCIRIYVRKKVPEKFLAPWQIIPKEILGIETDVVEIGEVLALSMKKDTMVRPLAGGVSIGHINITAGSLGWFFEDETGRVLLASNAHVFCDSPFKKPEEMKEKRILQPGPYHIRDNKYDSKYLVANYVWHKKLYSMSFEPSNCEVANAIAKIYNFFNKFGKTRLIPVVPPMYENNMIDFAVAEPVTYFVLSLFDMEYTDKFVGLVFAGSDTTGVICKAKYMVEAGYKPINTKVYEPKVGDKIKFTSFWCKGEVSVTDIMARINVSYGPYTSAIFDDVIMTTNPNQVIRGGCSGSSAWC